MARSFAIQDGKIVQQKALVPNSEMSEQLKKAQEEGRAAKSEYRRTASSQMWRYNNNSIGINQA